MPIFRRPAVPRIVCLGAGGHASVVVDLLLALGRRVALVGIIGRSGDTDVLGVPFLGTDADLERLVRDGVADHFVSGIGSVRGDMTARERVFELGCACGLAPFTATHPSAVVALSARLGAGSVVMAGSVIQARCRVGANVIINTRASIDHDCDVGDHSHLAPGVTCSGNVRIGRAAHVGTGAVILQNISVGDGATVAAGATVTCDCEPNTTVYGTPARAIARPTPGAQ